jgi:hypothetical protein
VGTSTSGADDQVPADHLPITSEHVVQFFDGPESLGEAVALFLDEGYRAGENLLVVAKPAHFKSIAVALARFGHPVGDLVTQGRMTVVDAAAALRKFMRRADPNPALFQQSVGELVRQLSRPPGVRIYGEMVEILAEEGNYRGAERLEELWNQLGAEVRFKLFCGYSSAHFAAPNIGDALRAICERHSHVHQNQADLLGNWLLANRCADGSAPA